MFSNLKRIFGGNSNVTNERMLFVEIEGFDATLTRRDGHLISYETEGSKQGPQPADVGFHYDLELRSNGTNPEYPKSDKPINIMWTQSIHEAIGISGFTNFIPKSTNFSRFKLTERFESGKPDPKIERVSMHDRLYPPHHKLCLEVYVRQGNSKKEQLFVIMNLMPRKSDMDSPAWKAAEAAPYIGMMN